MNIIRFIAFLSGSLCLGVVVVESASDFRYRIVFEFEESPTGSSPPRATFANDDYAIVMYLSKEYHGQKRPDADTIALVDDALLIDDDSVVEGNRRGVATIVVRYGMNKVVNLCAVKLVEVNGVADDAHHHKGSTSNAELGVATTSPAHIVIGCFNLDKPYDLRRSSDKKWHLG